MTIERFGPTERAAHWLLAGSFAVMLATGLALYAPTLAAHVPRPLAKELHLLAAVALAAGLIALVAGDRQRTLRRAVRDAERIDADDVAWLAGAPKRLVGRGEAPPQGRFNAGQKLNAAFTLGLMVVLYLTGTVLYLAERQARFRFDGAAGVHDLATLVVTLLVLGHLYLALIHPSTRHALRGMTSGHVDRAWAEEHHGKWVAAEDCRRR